jgi:protein gp37
MNVTTIARDIDCVDPGDAAGLERELSALSDAETGDEMSDLARVRLRGRACRIYETLHPETAVPGRPPKNVLNVRTIHPPFAKYWADKTGRSRATIYRDVERDKALAGLDQDLQEKSIYRTRLANDLPRLRRLAALAPSAQADIAVVYQFSGPKAAKAKLAEYEAETGIAPSTTRRVKPKPAPKEKATGAGDDVLRAALECIARASTQELAVLGKGTLIAAQESIIAALNWGPPEPTIAPPTTSTAIVLYRPRDQTPPSKPPSKRKKPGKLKTSAPSAPLAQIVSSVGTGVAQRTVARTPIAQNVSTLDNPPPGARRRRPLSGTTGIAWTGRRLPDGSTERGFTFCPWHGCQKVGKGCAHCYAETASDNRHHVKIWGHDKPRRFFGDEHWKKPLSISRRAEKDGVRRRIFCNPMGDVFEDREDLIPHRQRFWDLVDATPNIDWQLLTKRPENIRGMVPEAWLSKWPANVWIGTSVEDQKCADERIPLLLQVPARIRFVSYEPALELVDFTPWLAPDGLSWIIVGAESGAGARPFDPAWAEDVLRKAEGKAAIFIKQLGKYPVGLPKMKHPHGSNPNEWPVHLRVQNWPE